MRFVIILMAFMALSLGAHAEERITNFDVDIRVEKDGDIIVTETIAVIAEGRQIRRGIFRDLPRYYSKDGQKIPYSYDIRGVEKDGEKEPYSKEKVGNAYRIQIGDADVFLSTGAYTYKLPMKSKIRFGISTVMMKSTGMRQGLTGHSR